MMKRTSYIGILMCLIFVQTSCGDSGKQGNQVEVNDRSRGGKQDFGKMEAEKEGQIEQWISETELNQANLSLANSLYYTRDDGSSIEANAYLDDAGVILKIEEVYMDSKSGNHGKNVFYLKDGKKYASKELFEDHGTKDIKYVERITFYDAQEKTVKTKIRKAEFEEDLHAFPFQPAPLKDCSIKRVMDVLNQTGSFSTTFQGFVNSAAMSFLIVGENKPNGYVSTLAIQYADSTIKDLSKREGEMIGKLVRVDFQKIRDERGFEFQALLAVKVL
jgi:hypothetical protein